MLQIKKLDKFNADEVNFLRKQAYGTSKGMQVKDAGIFWNKSDDQSIVLGVFKDEKLIGTMRGEVVTSIDIVEKKMECPWIYGELKFPAMILSKAAIDSSFNGKGVMSVLRSIFFDLAAQWNLNTILGTMTANSLRINSMSKLGYEFVENPLGWKDDNYRSSEKVLISILDFNEHGDKAISILDKKYGEVMAAQYQVDLSGIAYSEVKVVS